MEWTILLKLTCFFLKKFLSFLSSLHLYSQHAFLHAKHLPSADGSLVLKFFCALILLQVEQIIYIGGDEGDIFQFGILIVASKQHVGILLDEMCVVLSCHKVMDVHDAFQIFQISL